MIELPKGLSEAQVIEICSPLITRSRDFVSPRRELARDRLKLYNNQSKKKNKQGDTLLYDLINTALAIFYLDEMTVKFSGRNNLSVDKANWVDKLAQFDHDEMNLAQIDYLTQWDRLFFGVGIKMIPGWNDRLKCPLASSMDTLSWLPDPAGYMYMENFGYHGFETSYSIKDIEEMSGLSGEVIKTMVEMSKGTEQEANRVAYDNARKLDRPQMDDQVDVVDLFCEIEKKKYFITFNSKLTNVLRCEELLPLTDEEQKDNSLIPFPLSLHYLSPLRSDPFGIGYGDVADDKHRGRAILKNLRIEFAQSQLYPMYLYNRDKIKNVRDLDFDFNKFVGISGGLDGNIEGSVVPMNKAQLNTNAIFQDEESLRLEAEKSTGISQIVQGFVDKNATLGQSQQAQANSNLRMMLGTMINNWGEKRFWRLWYRQYQANRPEEKQIRIKTSIGIKYYTIKKDDFLGIENPDIEIVSKIDLERKRNENRLNFLQVFPMINQDPTRPLISKKYAERKMMRLSGVDDDEISIMSPKTMDEVRSENENVLLEKQHVPVSQEEDHYTHIIVHSQLIPNKFLLAHIAKHWSMYESSGQASRDERLKMMYQQQPQGGAGMGGMANSVNQQAIAQETKNNSLETNQSIK